MRKVTFKEPIRLDLGCGKTEATKVGWTGMDFQDFGQDIVWDATEGIPLPDNSVEELFSSHFVEHIHEKDIETVIKEIARVCKHEAEVEIRCPHKDCAEAYYLAHKSLWDEQRIKGICYGQQNEYPGHFQIIEMKRAGIELQVKLKVIKNNIRR